ncbi:MAG: radical SAM protein [Sphaerochaetaceae bacterium]|nr:radical SAM protein [Sphaerochaetaceae bacterium]
MKDTFEIPAELLTKLSEIKSNIPEYVFSAMKWNYKDHITPFSDIDLRIVVNTLDENTVLKLNEKLANAFIDLSNIPTLERLIEHPPGKIILLKELELGLADTVDIKTWSFVHGNRTKFHKIKKNIEKKKETMEEITNLKNQLFDRITNYNLNKEPFFDLFNKIKYKKYCLFWHYYAYTLFLDCIIKNKKVEGKTEAISLIKRENPNFKLYDKDEIKSMIFDKKISPKKLTQTLKEKIESIINYKAYAHTIKRCVDLKVFCSAIQFLRAKPCRFKVYSKSMHKKEIINRERAEIIKIYKSVKELSSLTQYKNLQTQIYINNIQQKIEELNIILYKRINKNTLKELSNQIEKSYYIIEKNYLQLLSQIYPFSIDSFKIKITPKCTRHCSYCIFNDNNSKEMAIKEFNKILEKGKQFHFNKIFINGGEPTIHSEFITISQTLRKNFPHKEKILGTNCTVLFYSDKLLKEAIKSYDTFLIGCDDEHNNTKEVLKIVPKLRYAKKTVVINTVTSHVSKRLNKLIDKLCKKTGSIHIHNQVHHSQTDKQKNRIKKICKKYLHKTLLVDVNGNCHRCYNAVEKNNPEFNIKDNNFKEKLFCEPKNPYNFCYYCDEYDSK